MIDKGDTIHDNTNMMNLFDMQQKCRYYFKNSIE